VDEVVQLMLQIQLALLHDGACTGASYNPDGVPHGAPDSVRKFGASACHFVGDGCVLWRHIGDIGNVKADSAGVVDVEFKAGAYTRHFFSAQPKPFVTQNNPDHPLIPPNTSWTPPRQPLNAPPMPQQALTLSRKVDECKPLVQGPVPQLERQGEDGERGGALHRYPPGGRGLRSFTFQLNLSQF